MSLKARLDRAAETARKNQLAELGVSDPAEVKTRLQRLAELEAKNEEATRAQMSEVERLKSDLERERAEKLALKSQIDTLNQERSYEKQDQVVTTIASRFLSAKGSRLARVDFGVYVKGLTPKEQEALTDRDAQKWFQLYAKENPEFALTPGDAAAQAAATAAAAAKKTPATRIISTGLPARRATPLGGAPARSGGAAPSIERGELPDGKTIRPGAKQADRGTVRELFKKHNINYNG